MCPLLVLPVVDSMGTLTAIQPHMLRCTVSWWPALHFSAICLAVALLCSQTRRDTLHSTINESNIMGTFQWGQSWFVFSPAQPRSDGRQAAFYIFLCFSLERKYSDCHHSYAQHFLKLFLHEESQQTKERKKKLPYKRIIQVAVSLTILFITFTSALISSCAFSFLHCYCALICG